MVVNSLFETAVMTLTTEAGVTLATDLPVQLEKVNFPWVNNVGGPITIPTDSYDLISIGWKAPLPQRGQYFINQKTHARYQVFSDPDPEYFDHIECRVNRYPGGA